MQASLPAQVIVRAPVPPLLWGSILLGIFGCLVFFVSLDTTKLENLGIVAGPFALLLTFLVALFAKRVRTQAITWLGSALVALLVMLGFGFALGLGGEQFGYALDCVLIALVMIAATGFARLGYFKGDVFVSAAVWFCASMLALFIAYPIAKSFWGAFLNEQAFFDLSAAWARLGNDKIWGLDCVTGGRRCGVAWNTLYLGILTATGTTILGTMLALMSERGAKSLGKPLRILALLPIITPPFVVGLGLILLFGRAGLANQLIEHLFGVEPGRWFYGVLGVWIAQMFAFTPIAFLMMRGVIQGVSPSMEEAAQTLRASPMRTFMTVTFPLLKPGLASAFLVGFIESMADFGNPVILGGNFAVLSTDIFFAIVGAQLDQGRAAALAIVLTGFAVAVFGLQHWFLAGKNYTTVTGKGDGGVALPLPTPIKRGIYAVCIPWLLFTLIIYIFAFVGGFVQTWGRDYTPTLAHLKTAFDVEYGEFGLVWVGAAWNSFWMTSKLSAIAAPFTAAAGLLIAWLTVRTTFKGQKIFEFTSLLAFAIPGTVLGVAYVLAFNIPPFELTGTGVIIVLCFIFRNMPVGVQSGTAAFKQIDKSLDEASTMLGASTWRTVTAVILPLLRPALVASLIYGFVRSMTTISAVIFLVTAEYELATTFIIGRVGNGDYGVALAYCTVLIVFMLAITGLIQWLVGERQLGRRVDAAPMTVG